MSDYVLLDEFREWLKSLPPETRVGEAYRCPIEEYALTHGPANLSVTRTMWGLGYNREDAPWWVQSFVSRIDRFVKGSGWTRVAAEDALRILNEVAPHHPIQEPGKGDTAPMK